MDNRLIAIVLAVIVVVAGVGAAFVFTSDNGDDEKSVEVQATLSVGGNANNDYVIDKKDIETVKAIIDGSESKDGHPMADANNDGSVDDKDVKFIESMIKKENDHIYVFDDADRIIKVPYPITKSVVVGTNPITTAILIGATDYMLGYSSTSYPIIHKPLIDNAIRLGGTITDLNTDEAMSNFMKLDADCGGLDAVICLPTYLKKSTALIEKADIPIVRLDPRYGWDSIAGALTMGYMYGQDTEKRSQAFAELTFNALEDINKKLTKVTDKKTYISVASGNHIGGVDSAYNKVCNYAGGVPSIELQETEQIEPGSEGYKNYNPDFIVSFRTLDYSIDWTHAVKGTVTTPQMEWDKYKGFWSDMDAYKNLYYINLAMPVIAQIGYVAEIFYPDLFTDGYADKLHQDIVDNFMEYLGPDFDVVTDMTTVFGYNDITP